MYDMEAKMLLKHYFRGCLERGVRQLFKLRPIARPFLADSQSHLSSGGGGRDRYPEDEEEERYMFEC